jgi:hypothetical protein
VGLPRCGFRMRTSSSGRKKSRPSASERCSGPLPWRGRGHAQNYFSFRYSMPRLCSRWALAILSREVGSKDLHTARSAKPVCARHFSDSWYRRSDIKRSASYLPSWLRSCDLLTSGRRITQETRVFSYVLLRGVLPLHLLARFGREIALVQGVSCPIL